MLLRAIVVLALTVFASTSTAWTFSNATLSINERTGTLQTQPFSMTKQLSEIVDVPSNTLARFRFIIKSELNTDSHRAHQTYILLSDETGLETAFPADARDNGRSRVDIDYRTIPTALLGPNKPLIVHLLIGSFGSEPARKYLVGKIRPAFTGVAPPGPIRFGPKPEIFHIFGASPKFVSTYIATGFSAVVICLGVALIASWAYIGINLPKYNSLNLYCLTFVILLFAIEKAYFEYYARDPIFKLLGGLLVAAPITFYCGSRAMRDLQRRRLQV
ncbi:hypothetical protein V1512DRAFT_289375 [Lipomyces arxii]|uniref:uncharacterized protein n=1 Tax=Lipomyces arxii TaxID=56418 RepID=UPI0034CDC97A